MASFFRIFFSIILLTLGTISSAGEMPFNQQVFDELRAAGKPVVVHAYAKWCGTCKKRASPVTSILVDPEFMAPRQ